MSTDAFLKPVKKFLDKEVRIIPFLKQLLAIPQSFVVLFHGARLYFWNLLPDYFASAREAYKSLACQNLCAITLLLLWRDSGPAFWILGNMGALQKYKFRDGNEGKKVQLSFVILRTKQIFSGQISELLRLTEESYCNVKTDVSGYLTTSCNNEVLHIYQTQFGIKNG